jgi:Gas vesicle protein G
MLVRLLALPISGPVKASRWLVDQLVAAAEAELGPDSVEKEMEALRVAYDRGAIDADEFSARVDGLLDELLVQRAMESAGH